MSLMTQQIRSYSIEIRDRSADRATIFTFVDITAEELRIVITEFRRLVTEMAGATVINLLASARS